MGSLRYTMTQSNKNRSWNDKEETPFLEGWMEEKCDLSRRRTESGRQYKRYASASQAILWQRCICLSPRGVLI